MSGLVALGWIELREIIALLCFELAGYDFGLGHMGANWLIYPGPTIGFMEGFMFLLIMQDMALSSFSLRRDLNKQFNLLNAVTTMLLQKRGEPKQ